MNRSATWDEKAAIECIRSFSRLPGALLPALRALQDRFGYVDQLAIPLVASELNLSRAEVVGAISFYRDLRTSPPGRHVLRVCRAEACQARGADSLLEYIHAWLDGEPGQNGQDGFTVEPVYCLGNCALGPSAVLDGRIHSRLNTAAIDSILGAVTD